MGPNGSANGWQHRALACSSAAQPLVLAGERSSSSASSETIPAKRLEDLKSVLVFYDQPARLSSHHSDDGRVRVVESVKDGRDGFAEGLVQKGLSLDTDHVGAGVLVGHPFAVVIDAVPPIIVFKVVFKAMEDTREILRLVSVTEGHQLEQDIERQWG